MFESIKSKISVITSLFNRRDKSTPEEDVTADIAGTLEDISRQMKLEAAEQHLLDEDFFAPTHVLKPTVKEATRFEAAAGRKEKTSRRTRLTPDQYENIIENSLSVLDLVGRIIDRNRAITSRLKKTPA